ACWRWAVKRRRKDAGSKRNFSAVIDQYPRIGIPGKNGARHSGNRRGLIDNIPECSAGVLEDPLVVTCAGKIGGKDNGAVVVNLRRTEGPAEIASGTIRQELPF